MVDTFSTPFEVDVGQFGADNNNLERYKQAAEYAQDAEYWANIVKNGVTSVEDLLVIVQELYEKGAIIERDIEALKLQFAAQNETLIGLISDAQTAANNAENAVAVVNGKILEINQQLDIIKRIHVTVDELPPTGTAAGSYDPLTGEINLKIPKGNPGKDGTVTDLSSVSIGVPDTTDYGFYVEKTDNTVHKALMSDIAKTFPSVTSVKQGSGTAEKGDIVITPTKLGLGNVRNVASYSQTESDDHTDGFIKTYQTKNDAIADAPLRTVGEKVLVWNDYSFDSYAIVSGGTGRPNQLSTTPTIEKRLRTINGLPPDNVGNVQLTVPSGNPSLYIGEMIMFPYEPGKTISYNGIVPADGRLIRRDVETSLVSDLKSGNVKIVSETEWQAGAKMYFSWGREDSGADGTEAVGTYIRMPDWTGGEAIRTPDSTDDASYAGKPLDQVPYITKVNNIEPAADGTITITAANVGALATSGNAVSATKLVTARNIAGKPFNGTANIVIAASDVGALASSTKATDIGGADSTAGVNTNISEFSQAISVPNGSTTTQAVNLGQLNLVTTQIRSDVIPITRGGTGKTTAAESLLALGGAARGTNSDITALNGLATQITIAQGGTGSSYPFGASAGNFAQGNDARFSTVNGKSGGAVTGTIYITGGVSTTTDHTAITTPASPNGAKGPRFSSNIFPTSGTLDKTSAEFYSQVAGDNTTALGIIEVYKAGDHGNAKTWAFNHYDGSFGCPGSIIAGGLNGGLLSATGDLKGSTWSGGYLSQFLTDNYAPKSDINLKDSIESSESDTALDRISSIETKEFTWKKSGRRDRGFIAQDLQKIDPLYTYEFSENLCYSSNAILADLIDSVKTLKADNDSLRAEIQALKTK